MKPHNLFGRERGAVIVQVVIAILVIFGFVALSVDYGAMTVRQRQLQGATDAGALAAGPEMGMLSDGTAATVATTYTQDNGGTNVEAATDLNNHSLTVTAWDTVQTPFFGILGASNRRVSGRSVVQAFPAMSSANLRSIAVKHSYFNIPSSNNVFEVPAEIRLAMEPGKGNQWDYPNNPGDPQVPYMQVLPVNITGEMAANKQVADYIRLMKGGYADEIYLKQKGNSDHYRLKVLYFDDLVAFRANTRKAIAYNIDGGDVDSVLERAKTYDAAHPGENWENYGPNNPRLFILPVVNREEGNKNEATLKGFMGFFLESWDNTNYIIKGRFLRQARRWDGTIPDEGMDPGAISYGIFSYRLID